jgi:hypothetical protein
MRTGIPSWHALKLMALGAVSFWTPDIIWHAVRGPEFGRFDVIAMTVLMPSALTGIYILLRKRLAPTPHQNMGFPLMLGTWTLGMFFMAIAATVSAGGFVGPYPWDGVIASLFGLLLFPTFVMAAYEGTLGALVVATLGAIVIAVSRRRKQRRLPSAPGS